MPGGISPSRPAGGKSPTRAAGRPTTGRGRAKAPEAEPLLSLDTKLDLLGGALIIFALITVLSFLSREPGALTRIWLRFIYQTFGWGAYVVPFGIGAIGVWLIWRHFGEQLPPVDPVRITGALILFVGLLTFLHASVSAFQPVGQVWIDPTLADPATPGYTPTLIWEKARACPNDPQPLVNQGWILQQAHLGSYDIAQCGYGGGYIGAFIQVTVQNLIGGVAVFVIGLAAMIVGLMMATRTTLPEALQYAIDAFNRLRGQPSAKPTAYRRDEKGRLVPYQAKEEAGKEEDKEPKPAVQPRGRVPGAEGAKPGEGEEEKKPAPSPAAVPQGRPSIVTGLGPAGTPPTEAPTPVSAAAPVATAPAEMTATAPPSPAPAGQAAPPSGGPPPPASGAGPQPARPLPGAGGPPSGGPPSGPPKPPGAPSGLPGPQPGGRLPGLPGSQTGGRPPGLPGAQPGGTPPAAPESKPSTPLPGSGPVGHPGSPSPPLSRPVDKPKADTEDEDTDSDNTSPGAGSGGPSPLPRSSVPPQRSSLAPGSGASAAVGPRPQTPLPRPGGPPPAGASPGASQIRPGAGRTFGPPPPESLGGGRPAPKPSSPEKTEDGGAGKDDIVFDDLAGELDDLRRATDLDRNTPQADMGDKKPATNETPISDKPALRPVAAMPPAPATKEPGGTPAGASPTPSSSSGQAAAVRSDEGTRLSPEAASRPASSTATVAAPPAPAPKSSPSVGATPAPKPSQPPRIEAETKKPEEKPAWELPTIERMLDVTVEKTITDEEMRRRAEIIEQTLASFGAPGRVVEVNHGPVITQFGVEPDYIDGRAGKRVKVKVGKIGALADDLALSLAAPSIRIEAPVPGKGYVGIEVPNAEPSIVGLRDVMGTPEFRNLRSPLKLALGQDVSGQPVVADLTSMPHLLIAGTTGSGKSVCVNGIICTMLMTCTPDELKMIMVDPKRVELTNYNGVPHLMAPVVTELERIVGVLKWVQREMDDRYRKFAMAGARNITDYNSRIEKEQIDGERLAYIIVIVDELADLMMLAPDETERVITRLAQMARATGIHIIISTQRPSVDVVTGLIKANFPARIAFAVATGVDSRVILDMPGAEKLLGRGDMLFQAPDAPMPLRLQGVYVSDEEIERIVEHWRKQAAKAPTRPGTGPLPPTPGGSPGGRAPASSAPASEMFTPRMLQVPGAGDDDEGDIDDLFDEAVELVRGMEKASISLLQRHLRIGYTRAARLIDLMEERGVIGPHEGGSKPRVVLDENGNPLGDGEDDGTDAEEDETDAQDSDT